MQINTDVSVETVDNYGLLHLNTTHKTMAKVISAVHVIKSGRSLVKRRKVEEDTYRTYEYYICRDDDRITS